MDGLARDNLALSDRPHGSQRLAPARLLLLQRRLQESQLGIRLEKAGRGRVRLGLDAPVRLEWIA